MPSSDLIQSVRAQATLRLKFGLFVLLVMLGAMAYWGPARPDSGHWEIGVFGLAYLSYNFAAWYLAHRSRAIRPDILIAATAILDPLMLSALLMIVGRASILFVGFYLFTILGFGFRVGRL
jgi:two-component system sensor histidine kinase RpfC